ncbi:hypothetical protein [Aeoliella sp.]|uniref:hypothetical protein n=1 Tax=Aeoliella sp. TaxID=2795800 RepID=UPI003CCBD5CB
MAPQPRRRLARWSLRTALLVVTAICLWLGWHMPKVRTQQAAVEQLENAGVRIEYRSPGSLVPDWMVQSLGRDHFSSPVGASLSTENVDFRDYKQLAAHLRRLPDLRWLEITDTYSGVEEHQLQELLTGLDQIQRIKIADVHYSNLTRRALLPLAKSTNLIDMELSWGSHHLSPECFSLVAEIDSLKTVSLPWHATKEATRLSQMRGDLNVEVQPTPKWTFAYRRRPPDPAERSYWKAFGDSAEDD